MVKAQQGLSQPCRELWNSDETSKMSHITVWEVGLYTPLSTTHWMPASPGRGMTMGDAINSGPGLTRENRWLRAVSQSWGKLPLESWRGIPEAHHSIHYTWHSCYSCLIFSEWVWSFLYIDAHDRRLHLGVFFVVVEIFIFASQSAFCFRQFLRGKVTTALREWAIMVQMCAILRTTWRPHRRELALYYLEKIPSLKNFYTQTRK